MSPSPGSGRDGARPRDKMPWSGVAYTPADREPILRLIHSYYGAIETADAAFFQWQYFANPSGPVILWLAKAPDGALVGQHVLLPMRLLVDGADRDGCLSFNALVDPRYHGQGIWTGLGRQAHDEADARGLALSYGIPNPNSHRPMVKELDYIRAFDVPVLVKALDLPATARAVLPGWKGKVAGAGGGLVGPLVFPRLRPRPDRIRVEPVERFGPEFDRLAENAGRRYRILLKRDAAHLNWRYLDCPTRQTLRWAAWTGGAPGDPGRLLGYAVMRPTDFRGLRLGVLLDFLVEESPEGRQAGIELLARAEEAGREAGCPLLLTFCLAHTAEFSLLGRASWKVGPARLLPQPFPLLVRPLHWPAGGPDPTRATDWFLTTGDYDVF